LIICDLDDTLIDTSGAVTPLKLRAAYEAMGVDGPFEELVAENGRAGSSKEAIAAFVDRYGGGEDHRARAAAAFISPLPDSFKIPLTPLASEFLIWASKFHTLAIVTGGDPRFQREKIEKAGLNTPLFSKIMVAPDSVKKPYYEALAKEFGETGVVVGDRIEMDLRPAHAVGFRAVHMRWGRGRGLKTEPWIDHVICSLIELKGLL
jgi:FMN phosphatase YigB (HAD superfamily)